ncbi:MAG: hypothetical protein ACK5NF_07555 [Bacilli bacterium]
MKKKFYILLLVIIMVTTSFMAKSSAYKKWQNNGYGYSYNRQTAHWVRIICHGRGNFYAQACEGYTAKTHYRLSRNQGYWLSGYAWNGKCLVS